MRNEFRQFDDLVRDRLGTYVHALRDPRDGRVFYVGKGGGLEEQGNDRVFDHFRDTDECLAGRRKWDPKTRQIAAIWDERLDVEWLILNHKIQLIHDLTPNHIAHSIEATVIFALRESHIKEPLTNRAEAPNPLGAGHLTEAEVRSLGAAPVDPDVPHAAVFVFPIGNQLAAGRNPYEATRSYWPVGDAFRQMHQPIAVGLDRGGISRGVYSVDHWDLVPGLARTKYEFVGAELANGANALLEKNWRKITGNAGNWLRGNWLAVEFDGNGRFRYLRGARDHAIWFSLRD